MRQEMTQKTTATLQRCNASNVRFVKNRPFHRRKSTFASFMAKQKEAQKIRKYMHKTAKTPPNRHLFRSPPTVILYLIRMHICTKMHAKQVIFAIISPTMASKTPLQAKSISCFSRRYAIIFRSLFCFAFDFH